MSTPTRSRPAAAVLATALACSLPVAAPAPSLLATRLAAAGTVGVRLAVGSALFSDEQLVARAGRNASSCRGTATPWSTTPPARGATTGTRTEGNYVTLQADGNLVTYGPSGVRWNAGISGARVLVMQGDGTLVAYARATPVWASNTGGNHGAPRRAGRRHPRDLYDHRAAAWSSGSAPVAPAARDNLAPDQQLAVGEQLTSADGRSAWSSSRRGTSSSTTP